MSLISIIMPVYNSEQTLKKSIDSILSQTCENWELIAVDDGSSDLSLQILKEYSLLNQNVKVFSQTNAGPGKARNLAISKATGDYIAFLDSDDIYLDNELPTHYLEINDERVYFIRGEYFYIGDNRSRYYQLLGNLEELIAEYSIIEE